MRWDEFPRSRPPHPGADAAGAADLDDGRRRALVRAPDLALVAGLLEADGVPDGPLVTRRLCERGRVAEPREREGHVLAAEGVGVIFTHGGLCMSMCVCVDWWFLDL